MPLRLWTPPFPFSSRSNQAGSNLFYTCFIFTADLRISPYTAAHFSPKNGSTPAQSSNEGSPSMPEHPHHIRSEAYKYRFDLLFASLLCTTLNLREYLVFAYVVFFGWVTLELFRQIYTAPLVDRESVLAALCGLLLIGYCGFFVFVAVEFHQPGSFSGLTPGGQGFRDLFYFSYVTILTIGYGDITPHTWVAKNATILVALIAYMYSLVIVAMIVNQFAENRKLKQQEKARLSGSAQARRREAPPSGEND